MEDEFGDFGFGYRRFGSWNPFDAVRSVESTPRLDETAESVVWGEVAVELEFLFGDGAGVVFGGV